jgi:hypothetical protein
MTPRLPSYVLTLFACAASCGGQVLEDSTGSGPAVNRDAATDAELPWTQCSSPHGVAVCNGPASCPNVGPTCPGGCFGHSKDYLAACADFLKGMGYRSCNDQCPDGTICVQSSGPGLDPFDCAPFELGVLYSKNDAGDRVRYADMGTWTGEPLPEPSTCPAVDGIRICGGNCGGCPPGNECTGRSPLHPYGFCAPRAPTPGCVPAKSACNDTGHSCFAFKVQPEAQARANLYGICLPDALCQALAQRLPGGGTCTAR